jgi:iron transport multicopper oxidase
MRPDTVVVREGGNAVFRFKVDNPGIPFFHCHIEWHVEAGLSMVFIEAPTELRKLNLQIPQSHKDACKAIGIPMTGNAVGNTKNWLDLTGAPMEPPEIDTGVLYTPPTRKLRSRLDKWWEALMVD